MNFTMGGLHFDISADNSNFIKRLNEIKSSVKSASNIIQDLSKNFDVSTVENKVITLNKVIRDNEASILQLTKQMQKWSIDAKNAFNNNDISTFNTISKDIEEQSLKIAELTNETKQYYDALAMVESSGGVTVAISTEPTSSPQFFKTQQDYEYAEMLRAKIVQLQERIAGFDGSDKDLQPLRSSLSDLQDKLRGCELEAAKTASKLGENLGTKAAEASESLYQLNASVEKQRMVVQSLSIAANEAAKALETVKGGGDAAAIDDAQIKYDSLAQNLQNAQKELLNLQAAQSDASVSFQQINQEVEQQDSLMVKMLGGYENYQNIIGQLPAPIQGVVGSINGMTGAAKAFIATPLGVAIGAIVLVLQTLKTWFDSSVEGQLAFAEISGYVSGVLDQLKEIVINVGKAIYSAFTDPQKAISDLWEAIKTNIVNRFKAVGEIAVGLGKVIENAFSGNFDQAGEEISKLKDKYIQLATGIEGATGKLKNYVKGVHDAATANARLNEEEKLIEINASKESIETSRRNKRMHELSADMYNTSANQAKRKAALEEYKRLSEEQMEADLKLQDQRIALQEERMSLTTNAIEDENKLRELQKQRVDIEAQHASRMTMLQRRSNRINNSSGQTSAQIESKKDSSHQKLLNLLKQQAEERLMLQQEYEMELWQNRINLMDEGEAKVLEQMKLDQDKEKYSLEERKKQAINAEIQRQKAVFDAREDKKAAGNKKYAKQVFNTDLDDSSNTDIDRTKIALIEKRYAKLYEDLEAMQKNSLEKRARDAKAALNSYLAEYGTYAQKRKAISEQYDKQIKEAPSHGERLTAIAKKQKAESDLDFEEWQDNGGMSLAFGSLQNLSRDIIDSLISDMEKYRSKIISTFDPENIKTYEEALNNLRNARIDIEYDGTDIGKGLQESLSLALQYADKQAQIAEMEKQRKQIVSELDSLLSSSMAINAGDIVSSVTGLNGEQLPASLQPVDDETIALVDELRVKLASVDSSLKKANNDSKILNKQLKSVGKLKFSDFEKIANKVQDVAGKASRLAAVFDDEVAEAIGDGAEKFGEMYDAVKDITSGFKALVNNASTNITTVVQASGQAITTVSGSAAASMKSIESASAILAIIGAAIQLATIVASLVDPDKKHEKNIEALQDRIDALNMSYKALERTSEKLYSKDREESLRKQVELLHAERTAVAQQMLEEMAKRKTDEEAVKSYRERLQELDFDIQDLKESARDAIFGDDIKSQIEDFAENYADAWEGNEDRAMSARDTVTEMMKGMVKESIKAATQGSAAMEQIRNSLTEFYADGVLDKAEQDYIYGIADRLQKELDEQFAWAESLMTGDKFSQEASSRGFSGMSQDTGEELNGRFTALQESNERISQSVISMAGDTASISSNIVSMMNVSQDILNIHILNNDHLETIAKYSKKLAKIEEILSTIERKVKNI